MRKVIAIISDGGDNHSRLTRDDIRHEMRESDLQVYAVSLPPGEFHGPPIALEELTGALLLRDVARETGGRSLEVTQPDALRVACAQIARQVHNQYVLGYSPRAHDGRTHRITITVTDGHGAQCRVFHRSEVYVPPR